MKRLVVLGVTLSVLIVAAALSRTQNPTPANGSSNGDVQVQVEARNPWTHLRLNNDPSEFRFAIVSDRTGGHRARVFSQAVEQLNLLQPEFVLCVGDLIEGYTENNEKLVAEWREFQTYLSKLEMPFFYVPGNHDVANAAQEKLWKDKFGRRYYHFVYRNVLFLLLNSDDPNVKQGGGKISEEQIDYVKKALEQNKDVRWTIVSIHKPLWALNGVEKNGWLDVEKVLNGRSYTVFAGHVHRYQKFVRQGMNYYQLATTGGGSRMRGVPYGEFDHITWVTMKKSGPVLANILLDGVYREDMRKPITDEEGVLITSRRPTHPVRGQVHFEGTPAAGARVMFHLIDPETKKTRHAGDGLVDADGSFIASTYGNGDGLPVGEYVVTVDPWGTLYEDTGKVLATPFPAKYAKVSTSPLKATVKTGKNEFAFELAK
jgi:3',5'-cyclic AMP phosphodiesterase CpdA